MGLPANLNIIGLHIQIIFFFSRSDRFCSGIFIFYPRPGLYNLYTAIVIWSIAILRLNTRLAAGKKAKLVLRRNARAAWGGRHTAPEIAQVRPPALRRHNADGIPVAAGIAIPRCCSAKAK